MTHQEDYQRISLISYIMGRVGCAWLETGIHEGESAKFFSRYEMVAGCDINPEAVAIANKKLEGRLLRPVDCMDSRKWLKEIDQYINPIFYLDANWNDKPVVQEELEIISERWPGEGVVVVNAVKITKHPNFIGREHQSGVIDENVLNEFSNKFPQIIYPAYSTPSPVAGYAILNATPKFILKCNTENFTQVRAS